MNSMNPSENAASDNLNLPPPVLESGMAGAGVDTAGPAKINTNESPLNQTLSTAQVQNIDIPLNPNSTHDSSNVAQTTTNIVAPSTADDNDLIEKEWVIKAKRIVNSNRDTPYKQTQEINAFRADYMKKRYNKIIKLGE